MFLLPKTNVTWTEWIDNMSIICFCFPKQTSPGLNESITCHNMFLLPKKNVTWTEWIANGSITCFCFPKFITFYIFFHYFWFCLLLICSVQLKLLSSETITWKVWYCLLLICSVQLMSLSSESLVAWNWYELTFNY
jgi:hypothetical protein